MMKNNRKKRGFTIMETIIAMVVVVVVSIAAATATLAGIQAGRNVARDADAIRCAENVLECFKATDTVDIFGVTVLDLEGPYTAIFSVPNLTFMKNGYKVETKYTQETNTLYVKVTADDDEEDVIVEYSYTKGGTP